jgi:hypothetical protein
VILQKELDKEPLSVENKIGKAFYTALEIIQHQILQLMSSWPCWSMENTITGAI